MYYRICPRCGAHLDPQEECSCDSEEEAERNDSARDKQNAYPSKDDLRRGAKVAS